MACLLCMLVCLADHKTAPATLLLPKNTPQLLAPFLEPHTSDCSPNYHVFLLYTAEASSPASSNCISYCQAGPPCAISCCRSSSTQPAHTYKLSPRATLHTCRAHTYSWAITLWPKKITACLLLRGPTPFRP